MGDDIETGRTTGSDYWAALGWLSENQKNGHRRPEPMSSPINNLAYLRPYFCWNRSEAFSFKKPWIGIPPTDFPTFLWPYNIHGTYVKLFLSNDLPWLILFVIWISCWHYDRRLLWQQHNIVHYRNRQWVEIFFDGAYEFFLRLLKYFLSLGHVKYQQSTTMCRWARKLEISTGLVSFDWSKLNTYYDCIGLTKCRRLKSPGFQLTNAPSYSGVTYLEWPTL